MRKSICLVALVTAMFAALDAPGQTPLGPGFTYQGQLKQNGAPMNGTVNLRFSLWDAAGSGSPPSGGNQIGSTQPVTNVPVSDGLFTVTLNGSSQFGSTPFTGQARFLQVEVCSDSSCNSATRLSPRQSLTIAPYAAFAAAPWTQSAAGGANISYTAGNVGIGTAAPVSKLHVDSGANANVDLVLNSGSTAAQYSAIDFFDRGVNKWTLGKDNANNFIVTETGVATRLVVAPGGNVGVGTATPSARLQVTHEPVTQAGTLALEGTTHAYMSFYPDGFAAGRKGFFGFPCSTCNDISLTNQITNGNITLAPGTAGSVFVNGTINLVASENDGPFRITGSSVSQIFLAPSGHARIGEVGYWDHVTIFNDAYLGHGVSGYADLQDDGSWHSVSDRRMKTEIAAAEGLLGKALALRPAEFYMKNQDCVLDPEKHIGLIAQDVQPILPSLVSANSKDGMLTMNYDRIGVVAIGAIQEQQQIILDQKQMLERQQTRIDELSTAVKQLTAVVRRLTAARRAP